MMRVVGPIPPIRSHIPPTSVLSMLLPMLNSGFDWVG